MEKNIKEKIIDALEDKKTFLLTWVDRVEKEMEVQASSEEEAEKLFLRGELDFSNEISNSEEYEEDSLDIIEY